MASYIHPETGRPLFDKLFIGYTSSLANHATAPCEGFAEPIDIDVKYYWEFDSGIAYAVEQALRV